MPGVLAHRADTNTFRKLDPKALRGEYVGFDDRSKMYRILIKRQRTNEHGYSSISHDVILKRNVIFDEAWKEDNNKQNDYSITIVDDNEAYCSYVIVMCVAI